MTGTKKPQNVLALRWVCSGITSYMLAIAISLEMASPAVAQVMDLMASDTDLGDVSNAIINHSFTATGGTEPYLWSNLTITAGSPAVGATLGADGQFEWHTIGSPRPSRYMFEATVADSTGQTDVGSLGLNLIVPEPSSVMLLLAAAAAILPTALAVHRTRSARR